jgi:nucleoside-diphosphate-sugar epimerase
VLDNWKSDKYDWDKEIVLITGGAGGIGGHVVRLLAERGIKVVVLDVIPMSFETRMDSLSQNIVFSLHLQQQMSITTNAI